MSNQLQIQQVRHVLVRLEETIIFALIERSQYLRDAPVYETGRFGTILEGCSLSGFLLLECERSHAKVRRYTSPDEHPFFPDRLPEPVLPPMHFSDNPLVENDININSLIRDTYEQEILKRITQPGDDEQYGSAAVCDVACLQSISKRIHYGKFVAESKFRNQPENLLTAIKKQDRHAILHAITDESVEKNVLDRVEEKTETYTNELTKANGEASLQPGIIRNIYQDFIIPLNKEVQVRYLLHRNKQTM
jgi:chorismate mutase